MSQVYAGTAKLARVCTCIVALAFLLGAESLLAQSLRFFGTATNNVDRVIFDIDDPSTNQPGPPIDVGAGDFTIELWLRAAAGNTAGSVNCGQTFNWIFGHIFFDHRNYGLSVAGGSIAAGVQRDGVGSRSICHSRSVVDGTWHHVAYQRRSSDGHLWLFIDGEARDSVGPAGDVSYPDDLVPPPQYADREFLVALAAERLDADPVNNPAFFGWLTELRVSNTLRYPTTGNFTPPGQPFVTDGNTRGLYHFNEGSGSTLFDTSALGDPRNNGDVRFNSSFTAPQWSDESPFAAAAPSVQFSQSNFAVTEGTASVQITVNRTGGTDGAVSVSYSVGGGTAASGVDYQASSGTLSWGDGDGASKSFSIPIVDDAEVEPVETANVTLSVPTGGATLGNPSTAVLTLNDNDVAAPGSIQLSAASYSVSEGAGNAIIAATRTGGTDGAVSVSYSVGGGTAASGVDYQASSGTLSWGDGDGASKSFSIPIVDDAEVEPVETANVTLSVPTGGATLGNPSTAVLTLNDNDVAAPGSIQLSAASYSVSEGAGNAIIAATRTGGTDGAVSVSYSVGGGTAASGVDYQASSGTLSWGDGDGASKSFSIPIVDDAEVEPVETANVTLSVPTGGATLGNPSTAVLTLNDNDVAAPGSIQLSAASYSVSEGAGNAIIAATRTGGTDGAVSVSYSVGGGTAASGVDYQASSGTLSWGDGDGASKSFSIPIVDDAEVEPVETANVTLSVPTGGATLGNPSTAVLTLNDNDVAAPGSIQLSAASYSVSEGAGNAIIAATRTGGTDGAVSVSYSVGGGTAASGVDYQASSGTLSWGDGDGASKSFSIPIVDDAEVEPVETANVTLSVPTGGATLGNPSTAVLTLNDNDVAAPGSIQLSAASYSVSEGAGNAIIAATRTGGTDGAVSVSYSVGGGTAASGVDYQASSGTLSWGDGDGASKSFSIPIVDDAEVEPVETANVTLSVPTGGATLGNPSTAVLTLNDNDVAAPGSIQLSAASYSVSEGAGNAIIAATRTGGTDGAVSVSYSVGGGTAASGVDYQASSGTLSWGDGDGASKSFSIPIVDDAEVEPVETANVTLSVPTGGATLGNPSTAVLTLNDNDVAAPGSIQLSAASYSVSEGAGNAIIAATRTGGTDGAVSVSYSVGGGTAASGVDYQASSGTLSWGDGDGASKSFSIPIVDDAEVEPVETANVTLSVPTGGATLGNPSTAVLTLNDNDVAAPGSIQLSAASYSVSEGAGNAIIAATRTGGTDGAVSVSYSVGGGTAASGVDYQASSGTLSWGDGDGSDRTMEIAIIDDFIVEGDESVNISLSNISGAALGIPLSAMLTIVDDEVENPGSLEFSASSYNVVESAGSITIFVNRVGGASGPTTVDFASSDGSATEGSDYQSASGTLAWTDGDVTAKSFQVSVLNDDADELNETVALNLSNPGGGALLGSPASANITIGDDDTDIQPPITFGSGGGASGPAFLLALVVLALRRRAYRVVARRVTTNRFRRSASDEISGLSALPTTIC